MASAETSPKTVLLILSACNFVIGMGAFVVISIIEPMALGLDVSVSMAGVLLTLYAVAYAVLSPLLVAVTGSIGRRRVLAGGVALFASASALSAMAPEFWTLSAARILAAAGAGLVTPVAAAIAAGLSAPEARGKALAFVFFGLTLAQVAGIPVGSWLAYTFGWRLTFAVVAVLALPCMWLVWTRVPAGLSFAPVALRDLAQVLRDPVLMSAAMFTASFLGAIYVLFTYLPPLLSERMSYGRDGITLVLLVFGLGAVAGNLLGGWLTDRVGPVRTLTLLCFGQILLMPAFSGLPIGDLALLALVFTWSIMGWSFLAPQQSRLIALAPSQASVLLALNAAAIYIGVALGSAVGGVVLEGWGTGVLGAFAGIASLGALGHLLLSHRGAQRRG